MSDDILTHVRALRAYARSLCGTAADAEDLVQETLLRAIEKADSYQPGTHMRAWLFTIMRNKFFTDVKKAARERTGSGDCASTQPSVPAGQEWHLRHQELRVALNEMPLHYREAIVLVAVIGESYLDAARILDCDIGTIKSRVNRARNILRRALEPEHND
ncbi:sigma-70 family RNA polymerase sigma factor [Paracoccus siganidrum]|uniref:RNA polymerase sigma factor n=1 Tax=Paracoccus siganidrum TaxID=1276757 RepID=A0A419AC07_9RHOB|nr:sigma-70 family RNA polymerase sigma factor [Paracoccus siganidrum]RJL21523.1 sigma-70 family RNA polymerase sigma factor [Paracoccus siganidrum]RMC30940.1 RNA polymerase sigma factor [Paracoccus siganidrum]